MRNVCALSLGKLYGVGELPDGLDKILLFWCTWVGLYSVIRNELYCAKLLLKKRQKKAATFMVNNAIYDLRQLELLTKEKPKIEES